MKQGTAIQGPQMMMMIMMTLCWDLQDGQVELGIINIAVVKKSIHILD